MKEKETLQPASLEEFVQVMDGANVDKTDAPVASMKTIDPSTFEKKEYREDFQISIRVLDRDTNEIIEKMVKVDEYLNLRKILTLGSAADVTDEIRQMDIGASLIAVVCNECHDSVTPQSLQVILDRVHPSVFNPVLPTGTQIAMINRTLRAFLGAMPFDTMLARVSLQDLEIAAGEWATIFRKYILPCLIQYEDFLNSSPSRLQVDVVTEAEPVSTIESSELDSQLGGQQDS